MKSDLRTIPGVGPNMEEHLLRLGVSSVASLRGQDPEELYERDCVLHGGVLDPLRALRLPLRRLLRGNRLSRTGENAAGGTGRIRCSRWKSDTSFTAGSPSTRARTC